MHPLNHSAQRFNNLRTVKLHRLTLPARAYRDRTALGALPDQPERFSLSFLPFERRALRRDGLHLFSIRYWDSVLPVIGKLGEPVLVQFVVEVDVGAARRVEAGQQLVLSR